MKLTLCGHDYRYACEQMLLTLFPEQRPVYEGQEENEVRLTLRAGERWLTAGAKLIWQGTTCRAVARARQSELTGEAIADDRVKQRILKLAFYRAGCAALGKEPPWGALTGVRPVKLPTKALLAGKSEQQARRVLTGTYRVSPERAELAMDCARASVKLLGDLKPEEVSLYVGIPFCPTRCAYCSFVSADVGKTLGMVEPFLDCLEQELEAMGKNLGKWGKTLRTVYIGGGTPTTVTAPQLDRLLAAMKEKLDLSGCVEFPDKVNDFMGKG